MGIKSKDNAHYSYQQLILTVWGNKQTHIITNDYYCYLFYGNAEKAGPSVPDSGQKYNQPPLSLELHVVLRGSSHH